KGADRSEVDDMHSGLQHSAVATHSTDIVSSPGCSIRPRVARKTECCDSPRRADANPGWRCGSRVHSPPAFAGASPHPGVKRAELVRWLTKARRGGGTPAARPARQGEMALCNAPSRAN